MIVRRPAGPRLAGPHPLPSPTLRAGEGRSNVASSITLAPARRVAPRPRAAWERGGGEGARSSQGGFALIAAIFLLVVLGAFIAFVVTISMNAQTSSALAVQGARAYQAARAGVEWSTYQILDPRNVINVASPTPPDCFGSPATPALPGDLGQFSLTIRCTRHPLYTASPNYYEEASLRVAVYDVTATVTQGTPGASDYVERQINARIEQCKNPNASGPAYAC